MTRIMSSLLLMLLAIGLVSPGFSAHLPDTDSKLRAREVLNAGV
jgi:hypothetical protein